VVDTELKRAFGRVIDKAAQLNLDELLALEWWLDRVNGAAPVHGRYNAATDDRDMGMEAAAELVDMLAYFGFDHVKRALAKKRRLECFANDAIVPVLKELAGGEVE
jgi:hypothetical protein